MEENDFNGSVIQTDSPPPNSKLIAIIDGDIWRKLSVEMHSDIQMRFKPEHLQTGRYLDSILWLMAAPTVRKCTTTQVAEYECTRRIYAPNGRDFEDIDVGFQAPAFGPLKDFFAKVRHRGEDGKMPSVGKDRDKYFDTHIDVRTTSWCTTHLTEVSRLFHAREKFKEHSEEWSSANQALWEYLNEMSGKMMERTEEVYATEEKLTPGPVYFISNDRHAREVMSSRTTEAGRAIGVADLTGFLRALLESGYLKEDIMSPAGIKKSQWPEQIFDTIRNDINHLVYRDTEGKTPYAVHEWDEAIDQPGVYSDGTRGLSLRERLEGKAIFWEPTQEIPGVKASAAEGTQTLWVPPHLRNGGEQREGGGGRTS